MRLILAIMLSLIVLTIEHQGTSEDLSSVASESRSQALGPSQDSGAIVGPTSGIGFSIVEKTSSGFSGALASEIAEPQTFETTGVDDKSVSLCEAMRDAAIESGIPVGFFARLLWQQSRFRSEEISPAGAQGIAQFMPATAAEMRLDDPFDAYQAIPASAKLICKLHDQFGNLGLAAAAYNAGGGKIEKWLARRATLPKETRTYVRIITGLGPEEWTVGAKAVSIPMSLPQHAPCEGIDDPVAEVPVNLSPTIVAIMQKAVEEAKKDAMKIVRSVKSRASRPTKIVESMRKAPGRTSRHPIQHVERIAFTNGRSSAAAT